MRRIKWRIRRLPFEDIPKGPSPDQLQRSEPGLHGSNHGCRRRVRHRIETRNTRQALRRWGRPAVSLSSASSHKGIGIVKKTNYIPNPSDFLRMPTVWDLIPESAEVKNVWDGVTWTLRKWWIWRANSCRDVDTSTFLSFFFFFLGGRVWELWKEPLRGVVGDETRFGRKEREGIEGLEKRTDLSAVCEEVATETK